MTDTNAAASTRAALLERMTRHRAVPGHRRPPGPRRAGPAPGCGALGAGADVVQFRDKRDDRAAVAAVARRVVERCRAAGALFIVNDDAELAAAALARRPARRPGRRRPRRSSHRRAGCIIGLSVSHLPEADRPPTPTRTWTTSGSGRCSLRPPSQTPSPARTCWPRPARVVPSAHRRDRRHHGREPGGGLRGRRGLGGRRQRRLQRAGPGRRHPRPAGGHRAGAGQALTLGAASGDQTAEGAPDVANPGHAIAGFQVARVDPAVLVVLPIQRRLGEAARTETDGSIQTQPWLGTLDAERVGAAISRTLSPSRPVSSTISVIAWSSGWMPGRQSRSRSASGPATTRPPGCA